MIVIYYFLLLQSSWTKRAVEVDSPKSGSQWDQIAECPDSTCAQVVHSNAEICRGKVVPPVIKECPEQKEQIGKVKLPWSSCHCINSFFYSVTQIVFVLCLLWYFYYCASSRFSFWLYRPQHIVNVILVMFCGRNFLNNCFHDTDFNTHHYVTLLFWVLFLELRLAASDTLKDI